MIENGVNPEALAVSTLPHVPALICLTGEPGWRRWTLIVLQAVIKELRMENEEAAQQLREER